MTVGIHKRNSGHVNMGTVTLGRRVFIVKEARVRDHLVGKKKRDVHYNLNRNRKYFPSLTRWVYKCENIVECWRDTAIGKI